jgi:hypothetical protein
MHLYFLKLAREGMMMVLVEILYMVVPVVGQHLHPVARQPMAVMVEMGTRRQIPRQVMALSLVVVVVDRVTTAVVEMAEMAESASGNGKEQK